MNGGRRSRPARPLRRPLLRAWPALALALTLAACGQSGRQPAPESPTPAGEAPIRVLLVGDSLAEGYYATTAGQGFTELVLDAWDDDGDVVTSLATHAGWRTFKIAGLVEGEIAADLDVAVLEAGANDVGETAVGDFARAYRDLLARVERDSPGVVVVCLGPWGPPAQAAAYDRVVRRVCADQRFVSLSDVYAAEGTRGPVGGPTHLGARDGYHPNDRGHAALADKVLEVLPTLP